MTASGAPTGRGRKNWIAGLVVGTTAGVLSLIFPTLGWIIVLIFAVLALRRAPRLPAFGGLFVGAGASWLAVLIRAHLACQAFDAAPGQQCSDPDIGPWLAVGAALLAVGFVMTGVAVIGARVHR